MSYNFIFGDTDSVDLGVMVEGTPDLDYAEYDEERISIPGKSGDIIIDHGRYKNVDFQREINVIQKDSKTVPELVDDIIEAYAYLHGYQEFSETTRGDLITEAILENFGSVKRDLRRLGKATLKFNRKPFWYDATGLQFTEVSLTPATPSKTFTNPFVIDSKPIFKFTFSAPSNVVFRITNGGSYTDFTIMNEANSTLTIDCENKTAQTSSGQYINYTIPNGFDVGETTFEIRSGKAALSKVEIAPRWRCL